MSAILRWGQRMPRILHVIVGLMSGGLVAYDASRKREGQKNV